MRWVRAHATVCASLRWGGGDYYQLVIKRVQSRAGGFEAEPADEVRFAAPRSRRPRLPAAIAADAQRGRQREAGREMHVPDGQVHTYLRTYIHT